MNRKVLIAAILIGCLLPMIALAQSPGDTVGWTIYGDQTYGSTGSRCVLDSENGAHVAWLGWVPEGYGEIFYNFIDSNGDLSYGDQGFQLTTLNNMGVSPQIAIRPDNRPCVVFNYGYVFEYISWFTFPDINAMPPFLAIPFNSVDATYRYHLLGLNSAYALRICYSTSADSGWTWTSRHAVDTTMTFSSIIVSSHVSGKTSIVYTHPIYGDSSDWLNNVYYIESIDGATWDWDNKINISHYEFDEDSLYAFTDLDAVYENTDNLHIIWNAVRVGETSFNPMTFLFHYDTQTGITSEIAHHPDTSIWPENCERGEWKLPISKITIGVNLANELFTCYTRYNPDDCSANGAANGEIYAQYSDNNGLDWSAPINLTNSPSPGCAAGECNSDQSPSMAEKVNNYLHIFYVNDKDPSNTQQTNNPMLYLRYPVAVLGAGENLHIPKSFTLHQNYPNPFNAKTKIDFELKNDAVVLLDIFNITGAKVATLMDGELSAGPHSVVWDAGKIASGIYYYSLKAEDEEQTRRMVLIK